MDFKNKQTNKQKKAYAYYFWNQITLYLIVNAYLRFSPFLFDNNLRQEERSEANVLLPF